MGLIDEDDVDFQLTLLNSAKNSDVDEEDECELESPSSSLCLGRE